VKTPISNSPCLSGSSPVCSPENRGAEWDGSESTRLPWGRTGVLPIGPSLCRRPVVSFAAVFRPPRPTFRTRRPSYSQGRRTIFIQISFKHNQHRKNLKPEHSGRHSSAALHKNREPSVENFKFLLQTLNQVGQVFNPPSLFRFSWFGLLRRGRGLRRRVDNLLRLAAVQPHRWPNRDRSAIRSRNSPLHQQQIVLQINPDDV